ncbi:glycosyltransferase family 1 protein [Bradyrhizobium manausense]|uniref:glycosyltransferase family 4 protein n=1 Tax=Bradyrhizobium manausense TaxID=989370 RepID=UPI0028986B85|nr:glycosyltransferase family 1 protein [Bradyrhizobium manausense]
MTVLWEFIRQSDPYNYDIMTPSSHRATGRNGETKFFINGRFLSHKITGVERYAAEIVRAIDGLLAKDQLPAPLSAATWHLLAPPNASETIALERIKVRKIGRLSGHAWDQIDLARAAASGRLISLANSGPVLHSDQIVVIHDAQVFRRPDFFSWRYAAAHHSLGRLLARRATIATVSDFSRRELSEVLDLSASAIPVFPNSAEHFAATLPDFGVLDRLGIKPGRFFLSVGSVKKNKNISVAIRAAQLLERPDVPLVVVGDYNNKVFQTGLDADNAGVILAGRLSDGEIAALYARALAFVFPSLYEGFGVPPLEAMLFGCPVIASTAAAVKETCGEAAAYFDATDADALCRRMLERLEAGSLSDDERAKQQNRIAMFSWQKSAHALLQFLAQPRSH